MVRVRDDRQAPHTLSLMYGWVDRVAKCKDQTAKVPEIWRICGYVALLLELGIQHSSKKLNAYLCAGPILRDPPVSPDAINDYLATLLRHIKSLPQEEKETNLFLGWAVQTAHTYKDKLDGWLPMSKSDDFPAMASKWFFQGAQMAWECVEFDRMRAMAEMEMEEQEKRNGKE